MINKNNQITLNISAVELKIRINYLKNPKISSLNLGLIGNNKYKDI